MRISALKTIIFISLLLALFSFRGYAEPLWSNPTNTTPPNYELTNSTFNIIWLNGTNTTIVNTTEVKIIANFSGSNYSMSKITGDEYNGSYEFQETLGAGTYQWKSCAIDNEAKENCTGFYDFTIEKSTPSISLLLNGNSNNITLDRYSILNLIAQTLSDIIINISSNITDWIEPSDTTILYNTTNLTQLGIFSLTAYTQENSNYNSNNITYYVNLSEIPPQLFNLSASSDIAYAQNKNYMFNVTIREGSLLNVTFNIFNISYISSASPINIPMNDPSNFSKTEIDSNTKIYSVNVSDLPAGNYSYTWTAFDNSGNSNSITSTYNVSSTPVSLTWTFPVSWSSITLGTNVTVTCQANVSTANLTLIISDATSYSTTLGSVSGWVSSITPGNRIDSTCYITNNNYSANSITGNLSYQDTQTQQSSSQQSTTPQTTFTFNIQNLPSKVTLNAGKNTTASFNIRNTYQFAFASTSITLKNIDSEWYSLSRNNIEVKSNGTEPITITFNIPSTAEAKDYTVKVNVTGKNAAGTIMRSYEKTMTLTVNAGEVQANETEVEITSESNTTAQAETNQTEISPTGFSIRPEDFSNVVLLIGLIAIGLVFVFRKQITFTLTKGRSGKKSLSKISIPKVDFRKKLRNISSIRVKIKIERKRKSFNKNSS